MTVYAGIFQPNWFVDTFHKTVYALGARSFAIGGRAEFTDRADFVYGSVEDALQELPHPWVVVEQGLDTIPLSEFRHPEENVVYIVAGNGQSIRDRDWTGSLGAVTVNARWGVVTPEASMGIVLHDRLVRAES